MDAVGSSGRLVGVAGFAPVPRDPGRISGNMRRPHRYHRRLQRVFYLSAQTAARSPPLRRPSTTGREAKARVTSRRFPHSPAATSTFCRPSSATSATGQLSHRNRP
ncbi:transposase [Streptomyces sp. NPDC092295]|uniref:transposase n=1 Tax=Streptomyces sp. NPDC092295 TaxID=3366011 RepID=UPI003811A731